MVQLTVGAKGLCCNHCTRFPNGRAFSHSFVMRKRNYLFNRILVELIYVLNRFLYIPIEYLNFCNEICG